MYGVAERARFELAEPLGSTVFKTVRAVRGHLSSLTEDESETPRLTPDSMYVSMYGEEHRVILGPAPCVGCREHVWYRGMWTNRDGSRHRCGE